MSKQRTIPNPALQDVATFDILSDEQAVDPGLQILSISVSKEANRIPMARIIIRDGEAADETFEVSNQDIFIPGKKIHIKLGRDGTNQTVFKGIITHHGVKVRENGQSDLVIECKDESVKLTIGRHSRYYENQSDKQVIESIIGEYTGISSDVEDTQPSHKELVQHHSTDWDFILSRADVNSKLVFVDDGAIKIAAPDTAQNETLSLVYGATMLEFEANMDARTQWNSVKGISWDYANQSLFEATTDSVSFSEHGNISGADLSRTIDLSDFEVQHSGQVIEEELRKWVDSCMLKSRLSKIRGRCKIREGFADLKPGQMVRLDGVGDRFNGKAFVTAIKQTVINGEWDTHIQFGLSPEWFAYEENICDFPAAGLLPAIKGLQIGKVIQLENDPDGEDRIKVKIPVIDNTAEGIWCRIASLDAGNNRGAYFRPEIDDEVIVGFINDDPRDAVVLGMLNSSNKPAPLTAQDVNHEKGFVTRDELKVLFNDDTKTVTISTPAGNSVTLDEASTSITLEDQNDNKITMGPSGIEIESPNNIDIKAGANLTISATASLSISGADVSSKADGPNKMEGAIAKVSSDGITEVKGSLVKIN